MKINILIISLMANLAIAHNFTITNNTTCQLIIMDGDQRNCSESHTAIMPGQTELFKCADHKSSLVLHYSQPKRSLLPSFRYKDTESDGIKIETFDLSEFGNAEINYMLRKGTKPDPLRLVIASLLGSGTFVFMPDEDYNITAEPTSTTGKCSSK